MGLDDYIENPETWGSKGFPKEAYELIKNERYINEGNVALHRLTQIRAVTEITKLLN